MDSHYVIDITDNLTDLINDYNQWAMLTFDFRKRGDEECIRRYNCTNTDLFNRLRSSIIAKNSELPEGTVEDIELNEGYLFSKGNLEINLDKWGVGVPLWICGTSGDGKSTLSYKMAEEKKGTIICHTDTLLLRLLWTMEKWNSRMNNPNSTISKWKNEGDLAFEYIKKMDSKLPRDLYSKANPNSTEIVKEYFLDYFNWLIENAKNKIIIVEGCDIWWMDPEYMAIQPLIIISNPRLKSLYQRAKRDKDDGGIIKNIFRQLKVYNNKFKKLDDKKDEFYDSVEDKLKESVEDLMTDDFAEKVAMSRAVNNGNSICILIPGEYETADQLHDAYMRYINLPDNLKRQSDSYSMSIWGLSVFNMYNELKSKFEEVPEIVIYADESYWQYCIENNIIKNGIIQNAKFDLDSCDPNIIGDEKDKYDECKKHLNKRDFESIMNDFVPYFTPDELSKYESDLLFNEALMKDNAYRKLVEGLMKDYESKEVQNNKELKARVENAIVKLGWNPNVPITNKSIQYAKQRQAAYFEQSVPNIIDITHISDNINESSTNMRKQYESHGLYPVYIVLTYNGTIFNNLVKLTQGSVYTHAGISLDSNLKEVYSFTLTNNTNGFGIDTLNMYEKAGDIGKLTVLAIFVKKNTRDKIQETIKDFAKNKDKTKYSVGNVFNILFNRAKTDNLQERELVCSQFVDLVLRMADINITGKSNNLVIPQDFLDKNHKKVYKVYEGPTKAYKEKIVEKSINSLFKTYSDKALKYTNLMENAFTGLDVLDYTTENVKANEVIKYYRDLLTPEAIV